MPTCRSDTRLRFTRRPSRPFPVIIGFIALVGGCAAEADSSDDGSMSVTAGVSMPFTWRMAGVFVKADEPLSASAGTLIDNHFSYVGQYAVNGCTNNDAPYSCESNGCNYPGNPTSGEIPNYDELAKWLLSYRQAGLYTGIWMRTYDNVEA